MKKYPIALIAIALLLFACKSKPDSTKNAAPEESSAAGYTISPFSPSTEFADAKIESMRYEDGKFSFGVGGESYELGVQTPDAPAKMCANSGQGQHIHLIVDNGPYAAKYTSDFDYEIADGEHYLLAFLSRSYHESIKTADAHVALKVNVTDNSITETEEITAPMLFYSRPKGTYIGDDTKKVMLDFYLSNVTLGSDYNVVADINGEEFTIDTWQPYYVEGMPMGKNTITLTLVDGDGNTVDTPLNPVTREFSLEPNPIEQ
ncbi:MAG: hypothetical protein KJP00_07470 [Bacteroidia bacterium]|nr:hypothetical protein [Bacteroidia bacterium]